MEEVRQVAEGNIKRVFAFRLTPGMDVVEGIVSLCEKNGIKNGIILSALGSLDGARFYDPVELPDKKAKYGYSDPIILEGPIELLSLSGMICHGENDEILTHFHFSLSDQNGRGYGGHVIEGNKVLITVDVVLSELEGINMGRKYDENLELEIFDPSQG